MKLRSKLALAAGCVALAHVAALVASSLRADDGPSAQYCPPEGPPHRWSERWYDQEAQTQPGVRQRKIFGKLWPPFPRPTGKPQQLTHKYHSAHYWPFPYTCDDRMYVKEFSERQVESGWTTATTLYDYHFDDDSQEVNSAGRLHLRWILESAPISRRMVYVQSTLVPESSEARLASVRQELATMLGPEPPPPVMMRLAPLYGRPAMEIDLIRRAERDNLPIPHIQYTPVNGSGGGGSGGGGQGGGAGM